MPGCVAGKCVATRASAAPARESAGQHAVARFGHDRSEEHDQHAERAEHDFGRNPVQVLEGREHLFRFHRVCRAGVRRCIQSRNGRGGVIQIHFHCVDDARAIMAWRDAGVVALRALHLLQHVLC